LQNVRGLQGCQFRTGANGSSAVEYPVPEAGLCYRNKHGLTKIGIQT